MTNGEIVPQGRILTSADHRRNKELWRQREAEHRTRQGELELHGKLDAAAGPAKSRPSQVKRPGVRFRWPSRSQGAEDRRRRAQHAAQALSWDYRVNYGLTDAEMLVLFTHCRNADEDGRWSPSVAELCSRAGVSSRAAQMANRRLQVLGLLTIIERKDTPFRNLPNIYVLDENLNRSRKGAKSCAPKVVISSQDSTCGDDLEKVRGESAPRSGAISGSGDSSKSPPRWRWVSGVGRLHTPASETELKVLRAANRLLDDDQPKHLAPEALWSRAEDLLERYAPQIYGNLLAAGVKRHGFRALMAIYETALLSDAGHVRSGHGYLSGILRKSDNECNPHVTLSRLLAARRVPGFVGRGERQKAIDASAAAKAVRRLRDERSRPPALRTPG